MSESNATSETTTQATSQIGCLVSQLPEIYQPIYQHPELSEVVSRPCEDRLIHLAAVHNALRNKFDRPLRVLDLGCAQGFFSLNLAALGSRVHGVDYLDKNVAVCQALAGEFPSFQASFETGRVEDVIDRIQPDQFDLVLGLSIFHHLIHEHGLDFVHQLLDKLSHVIPAGLFEVALKNEPLYWGSSQPEDPRQMLTHYSFVHELGQHNTHLSTIVRPLYFASNQFWYLSEHLGSFDSFKADSHALAQDFHKGTRRYYFGEGRVVKVFLNNDPSRQTLNLQEHRNEICFLSVPPAGFDSPKLLLHGESASELWLVRQQLEGQLLIDYFDSGISFNHEQVIADVLRQLVTLEQVGLYHNDVRCWNVLMTPEKRAILIDYGAISSVQKDSGWPHDLLLAFIIFVREVVSRNTTHPSPIRRPLLDIGVLPVTYRNAFLKLLVLPKVEWSFSFLQQGIAEADEVNSLNSENLSVGFSLLLSIMEDASLVYDREIHHLRQYKDSAQPHIQWLENVWNSSKDHIEHLIVQLDEKKQELSASQKALGQQQAHSQWLEDEWNAAKAKVEQLNQSSHHWWTVAESLDRELKSVCVSRSWHYTKPLRVFGQVLRRWRAAVCSVPCAMKQRTKLLIRLVLAQGVHFVMVRPLLKAKVLNRIRKYPAIEARLRRFAAARGLATGFGLYPPSSSVISSPSDSADLAHLTPRARQIYHEIKAAIEKNKETR